MLIGGDGDRAIYDMIEQVTISDNTGSKGWLAFLAELDETGGLKHALGGVAGPE